MSSIIALRNCILQRDVTAVRRLLAEDASLTYRFMWHECPLHLCIRLYARRLNEAAYNYITPPEANKLEAIIKELLAVAKEANIKDDVLGCLDDKKRTPLHLAIESVDLATIKTLLNEGANVKSFLNGDTALHIASRAGHHTIIKYFLENHNIENSLNNFGEAAIHLAAAFCNVETVDLLLERFGDSQLTWRTSKGSSVLHVIGKRGSIEIAESVLGTKIYEWLAINEEDSDGNTPVYISARLGHVALTALLLRKGAHLAAKGFLPLLGFHQTTLELIATEFADPSAFFEHIFDDMIYEKNNTIYVNYQVLTGKHQYQDRSQIKLIEKMVRCGQRKLLNHPMIESLIYLKWMEVLPVFYIIIAVYTFFLITFNTFLIRTFNHTNNGTASNTVPQTDEPVGASCGAFEWLLIASIYMSNGVLFIQECIWIYLQKLRYFVRTETRVKLRLKASMNLRLGSWVKLCGILLAALVPVFVGCSPATALAPWQRHVACAALLLAWLQAMLLLSLFPGWGYYVLMLERVAINILKIFVTSIFLVTGFSICFMIQYQSKPPFDGPVAAFIKTLVMMLSEFDYGNLFDHSHDIELAETRAVVRLLFVTFVIFIAIVLMNFMIGVAVSDINELNAIGNIRRLEKQVELLSTVEDLEKTVLSKWWTKLILSLTRYHAAMSRPLVDQGGWWTITSNLKFYLYEFYEVIYFKPIPLKLHIAIFNIAKKTKQNANKVNSTSEDILKLIENKNKELRRAMDDMKRDINNILGIVSSIRPADKRKQ